MIVDELEQMTVKGGVRCIIYMFAGLKVIQIRLIGACTSKAYSFLRLACKDAVEREV